MSTIIVPLDGSPYNERTIRTIRSLALACRASIELTYVLTPGHKHDHLRDESAAERYLAGIASGLVDIGRVESHVVEGQATEQILTRVAEVDDSLVVLKVGEYGSHGRVSSDRVTQDVIRRSSSPVVAIQPSGSMPTGRLERLLVPLDGSVLAESILPLVIELAEGSRASVRLIWVEDLERMSRVYRFSPDVAGEGASIVGQPAERLEQAARRYLTEQSSRLASYGIESSWEVLRGPVAAAVSRCAWVQSSDLILMTTHGRSRLGVLALGSITQEVLRQSKSPVLILPPLARERLMRTGSGLTIAAA
ncbi:MAG TPA: universal stress protein [Thermomicrobiaceae bacterium]|nr:universal stress protein [Thermomicrobiaceae bacterium]